MTHNNFPYMTSKVLEKKAINRIFMRSSVRKNVGNDWSADKVEFYRREGNMFFSFNLVFSFESGFLLSIFLVNVIFWLRIISLTLQYFKVQTRNFLTSYLSYRILYYMNASIFITRFPPAKFIMLKKTRVKQDLNVLFKITFYIICFWENNHSCYFYW